MFVLSLRCLSSRPNNQTLLTVCDLITIIIIICAEETEEIIFHESCGSVATVIKKMTPAVYEKVTELSSL